MRVGVFICHCGNNIAGTVDVARVAEETRKLPGVVYATDYMYTCSEPGQDEIKQAIKREGLNSVVVAACSPRMHEVTFRRTVEKAGLNRYFFEMANIREHMLLDRRGQGSQHGQGDRGGPHGRRQGHAGQGRSIRRRSR